MVLDRDGQDDARIFHCGGSWDAANRDVFNELVNLWKRSDKSVNEQVQKNRSYLMGRK